MKKFLLVLMCLLFVRPVFAQQPYSFVIPDDWMVTETPSAIEVGNNEITIAMTSPSIAAYLHDDNPMLLPDTQNAAVLNAYVVGYFMATYQVLSSTIDNAPPLTITEAPRADKITGSVSVLQATQEWHIYVLVRNEPVVIFVHSPSGRWDDFKADVLALVRSLE